MYLPQITFTRFLAAASILVYHFGMKAYPFREAPFNRVFSIADMSVSYFFLLSGFIMAIAYARTKAENFNFRSYYIARLARIYPIYFISLLPFLIPRILNDPIVIKSIKFFAHCLLLQAWFPKYALTWNYTGWSLSVEIFFYVLFPFILLGLKKLPLPKMITLVVLIWAINQGVYFILAEELRSNTPKINHFFIQFNPILHLGTFILGMGGGLLLLKYPAVHSRWLPTGLAIIAITCLLTIMLVPNEIMFYKHNGLLSPLFLMLLFGLAWDKSFLSKVLSHKWLVLLGEISYGIYILQEPVRMLLTGVFDNWMEFMSGTIGFFTYVLILILISGVLYFLVESPVRIFVKNYLQREAKLKEVPN